MTYFTDLIIRLNSWGLMDVIIPFLLIFTLVFAILQKVKPLGEDNPAKQKGYNVIIAICMALAVVVPHVAGIYPPGSDVVTIINNALPQVSIVLVALLMVLLIVGIFGGKPTWGGSLSGWLAFGAFALVVYIFGRAAGWFEYMPNWLYWLDNPDTQAMIIVFAVFAILIWYITKEPGQSGQGATKSLKDFGDSWANLFGGGKK